MCVRVCSCFFLLFFFSFWIDGSVEKEVVQTALRGGTRSCVGGERALNLQSNLSTRHAKKKKGKEDRFRFQLSFCLFYSMFSLGCRNYAIDKQGKKQRHLFFFLCALCEGSCILFFLYHFRACVVTYCQ